MTGKNDMCIYIYTHIYSITKKKLGVYSWGIIRLLSTYFLSVLLWCLPGGFVEDMIFYRCRAIGERLFLGMTTWA